MRVVCNITLNYLLLILSYFLHSLQVYNETIRDLLVPSGPLDLREDSQRGLVVTGLTKHQVLCVLVGHKAYYCTYVLEMQTLLWVKSGHWLE